MRRTAGFSLIATAVAVLLAGCKTDIHFDAHEFDALPVALSAPQFLPTSDTLRVEYTYRRPGCSRYVGQLRDLNQSRFVFAFHFEEAVSTTSPPTCTSSDVSDAILLPPPRADTFVVQFSGQGTTLTATVKAP